MRTREKLGLEVCPKCGWHVLLGHGDRCDTKAGANAARLEIAVPEVPSTRLGYGSGMLVFDPDDDFTIQFSVNQSKVKPFSMRDLHLLDSLSVDAAADLVRTLAEWRKRWPQTRKASS